MSLHLHPASALVPELAALLPRDEVVEEDDAGLLGENLHLDSIDIITDGYRYSR